METRDIIIGVGLAGLIALLGVTAFTILSEDTMPDYEYLEYVPIEDFGDVDAVSGCAEVAEVAGKRYLRMADVGEFAVYGGGKSRTFTVGPARIDLFLLTGQSNSCYYTSPQFWPDGSGTVPEHDPGESPLEPGTAFYLGVPEYSGTLGGVATSSNLARSGVVDMTAPDGSIRLSQTYPVLMYDWIKETGHRVMVINSGIGGRAISTFMDGGQCYNWTMQVVQRAAEVLDPEHFDYTPVAVLWSQGEADKTTPVAAYEERLETLIGYFTGGVFGIAFPVMLSSLPTYFNQDHPFNSSQAQENVASYDERFRIASYLPKYLPYDAYQPWFRDGVHHYTQLMYDWMGEAFAREAAKAAGFQPVTETIAYVPDAVEGQASLLAYGTSGTAYAIEVTWEDGEATVVMTPSGTSMSPSVAIIAQEVQEP